MTSPLLRFTSHYSELGTEPSVNLQDDPNRVCSYNGTISRKLWSKMSLVELSRFQKGATLTLFWDLTHNKSSRAFGQC